MDPLLAHFRGLPRGPSEPVLARLPSPHCRFRPGAVQDLLWEGPQNDPLFWPLFEAYFEAPEPQMGPKMGQFPLRTAGFFKMHFPGRGPPGASQGPYLGPYFEGSWGLTHVQPHLSWPKGPQNRAQNRASRGPYRPIWAPILGPILEGSWGLGPVQPHLSPPKPQNPKTPTPLMFLIL